MIKQIKRKQYCLLIYKAFRGESAHYVLIKDDSMSLRAENISVNTCDDVILYVSYTKGTCSVHIIVESSSSFLLHIRISSCQCCKLRKKNINICSYFQ